MPNNVENELQKIIKQYGLEKFLTVIAIKDLIWNEEGDEAFDDYIKKTYRCFKNINELSSVLQVFNDAWNFFPHKCLNGKSPAQMIGKSKK